MPVRAVRAPETSSQRPPSAFTTGMTGCASRHPARHRVQKTLETHSGSPTDTDTDTMGGD